MDILPPGDSMLSFPIKPMLLQSASEPFDSQDYIYEWKVDGIRCIMFYNNRDVQLQSKTGKDCTRMFPELCVPSLAANEVVLDGEITVLVNGRQSGTRALRVLWQRKKVALTYQAKDRWPG